MKVGFMIVGAMKSGTSTLARMVELHPDICFSSPKEPQFFSNYDDWRHRLDQYHSYFPRSAKLYAEGSTNYTKYPGFRLNIWDDIYEYNRDMKFIYVVRDPVERVISHYSHIYESGFTDFPIDTAIRRVPELINTSRYYTQISPYVKKFGRERVHLVVFEQMVAHPEVILNEIFQFLKLDKIDLSNVDLTQFHSNKSYQGKRKHHRYKKMKNHLGYKLLRKVLPGVAAKLADNSKRHLTQKPKLSPESIDIIQNMVEADVLMLQNLFQADLSLWMQRKEPALDSQFTDARTQFAAPES
jgi:hypothetical protein